MKGSFGFMHNFRGNEAKKCSVRNESRRAHFLVKVKGCRRATLLRKCFTDKMRNDIVCSSTEIGSNLGFSSNSPGSNFCVVLIKTENKFQMS